MYVDFTGKMSNLCHFQQLVQKIIVAVWYNKLVQEITLFHGGHSKKTTTYASRLLEIAWKPVTQIETCYFSPLLLFHVQHTSHSPSISETPGEWTHSSSDPLRAAEQGIALLLTLTSAFSRNAVLERVAFIETHTNLSDCPQSGLLG